MTELFANLKSQVESLGYQVYDIDFNKQNKILTILIEKSNGITLDDCVVVSEHVNKYLDKNEVINEKYMLDVSSPGIYRPLKTIDHYQAQIGYPIEINLYKKNSELGKKQITGILTQVNEDGIVIDGITLNYNEICNAKATDKENPND